MADDDDIFAGYRPPDWPYWNTQPDDPVPTVDPLVKECFPEMSNLYLEAARRLPIADIPYLATCLAQRGLAVGLCDPVTSILLTTIYALALDKQGLPWILLEASKEEALKQANNRLTFVDAVHRSHLGQISFMTCYFRYLTYDDAKRCLDVAGHDLPLAVSLVQRSCGNSLLGHPDPDSATTKAALEKAAMSAWCSDPQTLMRLMTSRFRRHMLAPVLEVLRYRKQLSADWVYRICDLLCQPCSSPPPSPIPMLAPPRTFRDRYGQVTTIIVTRKDLFPAPSIVSQDHVSMAIISSSTRPSSHGDDDTVHMSTALAPQKVHDDDRFCSWEGHTSTWFLKMSLLETMHELYITALARLPMYALHQCHLIHAVLAAGHSYGPMHHPVANIMFNSIWYDTLFPFLQDAHQQPPAADVLDPRCVSRVKSRSLDAIVALISNSDCVTPREALEQLCKDRLWARDFMFVQDNVDDVLLAAKHPQPAAYKAFIQGLTSAEAQVMRGFMTTDHVISDEAVYQLKEMITRIAAARGIASRVHKIAPAPSQSTLESAFEIQQQDYVRRKLKQLLDDYSLREGQQCHLGLICGVAKEGYGYYNCRSTCYHVNFLVSMHIGVPTAATPTPMHRLFFAEFWSQIDERVEESTKPPICCVLQDCPKHFGRCNVRESSSSTIVHPPCCGYFMANTHGRVFRSAESLVEAAELEADPGGMLDMDFDADIVPV